MKQRTNIHKLTLALLLANSIHSTAALRDDNLLKKEEAKAAKEEIASELTLQKEHGEKAKSLLDDEDEQVMTLDDYIAKMNVEDTADDLGSPDVEDSLLTGDDLEDQIEKADEKKEENEEDLDEELDEMADQEPLITAVGEE
jgi:hypothetical protein